MILACPGCGKRLKLKNARPGAAFRCPGCARTVRVPAPPKTGDTPATAETIVSAARPKPAGRDDTFTRQETVDPSSVPFDLADEEGMAGDRGVPGKTPELGKYDRLVEIGRGGMGVVYRARQKEIGRTVAIKMLPGGLLAHEAARKRFLREARAVGKLHHPNIVPIHDVGEHEGAPYYVMDFVDGIPLDRMLARGALSPEVAVPIVRDVARALQHAHEQGIVHRDVKPANILVDREGQPLLADFGLARDAAEASIMTLSGDVMGTPAYMAPEQAEGHVSKIGPHTDVYALGTILYHLLSGKVPFEAATIAEAIRMITQTDATPLHRVAPDVPRDLALVCGKGMAKEIEDRYPSAEAMADDLDRWLDGEPVEASAPTLTRRVRARVGRHRLTVKAVGITTALLLALGAGLWAAFHKGTDEVLLDRARAAAAGERAAAIASIGERLRGGRYEEDFADDLREAILAGFEDADATVRSTAIATAETLVADPAIRAMLRERAVGILAGIAQDEGIDRERRLRMVRLLGDVGGKEAGDSLLACAASPDLQIAQAAIRTLGETASDLRTVERLLPIAHHKPDLRTAIEETVVRIYERMGNRGGLLGTVGAAAGTAIEQMAGHQEEFEEFLREVEPGILPPTVAERIRHLESPDAGVRLRTAYELGRIGHPGAVDPLFGLLDDADPAVARGATEAILAMEPPGMADRFGRLIESDVPAERREAAYAAGALVMTSALDALLLLTTETQPRDVRREAARALGRLGRDEARSHLIALLSDPALQESARAALVHLTGEDRGPDPAAWR